MFFHLITPFGFVFFSFFDREENTAHNVIERWKEKQCISEMLSHKIFKSFIAIKLQHLNIHAAWKHRPVPYGWRGQRVWPARGGLVVGKE